MAKVYAKEHMPLPNKRFNHMPEPDELTALLVSMLISVCSSRSILLRFAPIGLHTRLASNQATCSCYQDFILNARCNISQEEGADEAGSDEEEEGARSRDTGSSEASDTKELAGRVSEKKTQTDRNRIKRRRDAEGEQTAKQKLKKQRRDLENLTEFNQEIVQQELLQQAKAIRKAVTKAEKALIEPPKLGKHKFQPANIQVPFCCAS